MTPALADGTPAGTTIDNTAYGSFENPADPGTVIDIDSNTVTLTIAEVAGVDVAAGTATEAPGTVANAGPSQGDGVISSEDVVYFTFRITNIGNDQTQFFVPGSPANVVNGALSGSIEIIGYNDGTTTTSISGVSVPAAGATTGALIPTQNDGSVPVDGYIEVQIPIKADAGLDPSVDQITVVLGNTPSTGDQNVAYTAGGEFAGTEDVYTQDNPDGNGVAPGDLAGGPNPEREASDTLTTGLGTPNLDYGDAPDISAGAAQDDYQTEPGRGPSHVVDGVIFLGSGVDAENVAFDDGDPEDDGVVVNDGSTNPSLHGASFIAGQAYTLDVTTAGTGVLNAWIDFNRDGDFDDSGEQIAIDAAPSSNLITINGTAPFGAVAGTTYARFRYSSSTSASDGLGPNTPAPDGEVEDYQITLVAANPALKLVKRVTSINGTAITTVLDDTSDPNDNASNWPANFLQGAFDDVAEPGQVVDYTIYFLSDGNTSINNVKICDLVPDNTTYVPNSLLLSQGGGAVVNLSDVSDTDAGESFTNTGTPGAPCDRGTNTDGGVLVQIPGVVPNADSPGSPASSYGYIRFSVTID